MSLISNKEWTHPFSLYMQWGGAGELTSWKREAELSESSELDKWIKGREKKIKFARNEVKN